MRSDELGALQWFCDLNTPLLLFRFVAIGPLIVAPLVVFGSPVMLMFSVSCDAPIGPLFFHDASVSRKTYMNNASHYGQTRL